MSVVRKRKITRSDLDVLLDSAFDEDGAVIIRRPGRKDLALIPAERLRDIDTTDYLLASPKNRRRLLGALKNARAGKGRTMSSQQLRKAVGFGD